MNPHPYMNEKEKKRVEREGENCALKTLLQLGYNNILHVCLFFTFHRLLYQLEV